MSTPERLADARHAEDRAARDLRERVSRAAYPLFAQRGIRDVSLAEIERAAGVTPEQRAAVFPSKDDVATDFLARRERDWTIGVIEAGARERGHTPEGRLLAIFDVFDDWFHRDDYEACSFVNVLLEMGAAHPLGQASIQYLLHIRQIVMSLATEANLRDPVEFSRSWHILMKGSIISAAEGDSAAAMRAQAMGRALIAEHRPTLRGVPTLAEDIAWDSAANAEWTVSIDRVGTGGGARERRPSGPDDGGVAFDYEYDLP